MPELGSTDSSSSDIGWCLSQALIKTDEVSQDILAYPWPAVAAPSAATATGARFASGAPRERLFHFEPRARATSGTLRPLCAFPKE
jgi:hypothetical protein